MANQTASSEEKLPEGVTDDFAKVSISVTNKLEAFRRQVNGLSKKELIRVLLTIVENPLEQTKALQSATEVAVAEQGIEIKQDMFFLALEHLESEGEITRHTKTEIKEEENGEE
jgi:hypothetical protein